MVNPNYMFYIFILLLFITICVFVWFVFFYNTQKEQYIYEYVEEVPIENFTEENLQIQNELIENVKNA